ncbi:membrane hypothetical protein [uncultured Gammaproteobacteria bacterium]
MMRGGRKSGVPGRSLVTRTLLVFGLAVGLATGPAWAGSSNSGAFHPSQQVDEHHTGPAKKPSPSFRAMDDGEFHSSVCVVSGSLGLGAAYWYGPTELIMFIGGGLLAPSTASLPLFLSLLAQAGGAACAIGYAIAPAFM